MLPESDCHAHRNLSLSSPPSPSLCSSSSHVVGAYFAVESAAASPVIVLTLDWANLPPSLLYWFPTSAKYSQFYFYSPSVAINCRSRVPAPILSSSSSSLPLSSVLFTVLGDFEVCSLHFTAYTLHFNLCPWRRWLYLFAFSLPLPHLNQFAVWGV